MVYIENNDDYRKIDTNNLIVLCETLDDYKPFCDDLGRLVKSKSNRDLAMKVYKVIQRKVSICSSKYNNFIEKHKDTIEIMKKYWSLGDFIICCYDRKGNRIENLGVDYFYKYIKNHKKDIETIKKVALKIKSLGFDKIYFQEKADFTEMEYDFTTQYTTDFAFLENMEVNPTYLNQPIKYRTNESCYRMYLSAFGNNGIFKYGRKIELNSLIFDSNRLPDEITTESTIDVIYELVENEKKKSTYEDIRNSVDLSIATSDLTNDFEHLKYLSENIDKIKDSQELVNLLGQMQNTLTKIQLFGKNFEKQIIDSHDNITGETMEKEKTLYLKRRFNDSMDID